MPLQSGLALLNDKDLGQVAHVYVVGGVETFVRLRSVVVVENVIATRLDKRWRPIVGEELSVASISRSPLHALLARSNGAAFVK